MTPVLNQQEDAVTCHTTKPEKTGICQPWRTVFEGWPFSASARPEAIWEYLGQKFSFQGSLYWLIQILTGTGFQFRVECPIMRCPNGRKEPEQQVNPSWCTWRPRPCGVGPRTGLRTQAGYTCAPRKPLLSTHNAEEQTWMTHQPGPKGLGTDKRKNNLRAQAPLEKPAAKLRANLGEQVCWCQSWARLPLLPDTP